MIHLFMSMCLVIVVSVLLSWAIDRDANGSSWLLGLLTGFALCATIIAG
jgi:hypothetical protein